MSTRRLVRCVAFFAAMLAVLVFARPARAQARFAPIPAGRIDQAQKAAAQKVADRTLKAWRDGRFAPLSDDWTLQMKSALPPAKQRESYEAIRGTFGDYRSLEFAEAVAAPELPGLVVYRFRGTFSKTSPTTRPEVRVVVDGQGKVAGFWCKVWSKALQ